MVEAFTMPEYHAWPFFYTIQKNIDTRERQMKMWSDLILAFCKFKGVYQISLGELYGSDICNNAGINRRLSMDNLTRVAEWMQTNKFGEFTAESKESIFVYWRSLQEIAQAIHRWADSTGRIGSVEVILDLTDDSSNRNEIFY
mmetsp:Transcript_16801/g.21257  ORF Transcript_16801/g.21257 Transcript_16801/m.21257 type:complete len:143 (-) Transcript_16801:189-617(-)|eukprot:CAMPEP_0170457448 /NCGR_PEP_ID=MMETSP0123-20130129/4732_1 /TAXON_ID=182087 /ORGANISM="Favella ehrenbergii, Strain Fehren 1" /LENGTH=142 /DNA_ID=CAMNT_0010721235 /DNA_START=13 /DNA_END=441 /DNA_ORIENTATION=+